MQSANRLLEFCVLDATLAQLPEFLETGTNTPYVLIPAGNSALRTRNNNAFDVFVSCEAVGDWQSVSPVARCIVPAGQAVDFSFVNLPLAAKGLFVIRVIGGGLVGATFGLDKFQLGYAFPVAPGGGGSLWVPVGGNGWHGDPAADYDDDRR